MIADMAPVAVHDARMRRRRALLAYFGLALGISWLVELPLIALNRGWIEWPVPFALHYLASLGPAIAALVVTACTGGSEGLRELLRRITKWRVGWGWALVAALSPAALFGVAAMVVRLFGGEWPVLWLLGQVNYLPYLGLGAPLLWLATFGFGEEIGWRGFALPRLQHSRSASAATLILGLMWVLWHVPTFFYHSTYEDLGLIVLPGMIFGILCGAVVMTWLYNSTHGSVLMVALWHGLFDFFTASAAGQGATQIIMSAGVIAWALLIANRLGPDSFSRSAKHVL